MLTKGESIWPTIPRRFCVWHINI